MPCVCAVGRKQRRNVAAVRRRASEQILGSCGHAPVPAVLPCSTHLAVHDNGVTWTFIRRAQRGQNRGGSNRRAATHASCPPPAAGRPQRSQKAGSDMVKAWLTAP